MKSLHPGVLQPQTDHLVDLYNDLLVERRGQGAEWRRHLVSLLKEESRQFLGTLIVLPLSGHCGGVPAGTG